MWYRTLSALGMIAAAALTAPVLAYTVNPVTKDISTLPTNFTDSTSPIKPTRTGFDNNTVQKFTITAPATATKTGGSSFVLAVSNGENGINGGPEGGNVDIPNPTPVGTAIDIANGGDGTQGHKIQNGNVFRFSVWMQQNPADNVTYEPSVEPVLKFELWKEAQSINGDFVGQELWSTFGDRLWDTDINASNQIFIDHNQSQASHFDISGNGTVVGPDATNLPATGIVPPATGVQWMRYETTIRIDDNPDGNNLGWLIATQRYKVDALEEVRATFFVGDYFGTPPASGGSFFVDNALLEVFPDQAAADATPNPNPMPIPATVGDYNDDGKVNAADYTVWRDHLGGSAAALFNRDPNVTGLVKEADYTSWKNHFGQGAGGSGSIEYAIVGYSPSAAVPEPGIMLLSALALTSFVVCVRRH